MKYGYLGLAFILFGMFGLVFIVLFEAVTINNESEYYVLKEAMEAAMVESVDIQCLRNSSDGDNSCGDNLKISEQKFVENFTRRFADSITGDATQYIVEFYDIIESPPKATVVIKAKTKKYQLSSSQNSDFQIVNNLTGILEFSNYGEGDYNFDMINSRGNLEND